jgi:hypothetical protein
LTSINPALLLASNTTVRQHSSQRVARWRQAHCAAPSNWHADHDFGSRRDP